MTVYQSFLVIITGGFPDIELDDNDEEQRKLLDKKGEYYDRYIEETCKKVRYFDASKDQFHEQREM